MLLAAGGGRHTSCSCEVEHFPSQAVFEQLTPSPAGGRQWSASPPARATALAGATVPSHPAPVSSVKLIRASSLGVDSTQGGGQSLVEAAGIEPAKAGSASTRDQR